MEDNGSVSRKRACLGLDTLAVSRSLDQAPSKQDISFEQAHRSFTDILLPDTYLSSSTSINPTTSYEGQDICFGMLKDIPINSKGNVILDIGQTTFEVSSRTTRDGLEAVTKGDITLGFLDNRYSTILKVLRDGEDLSLQYSVAVTSSHKDSLPGFHRRPKFLSPQQSTRGLTLSIVLYGPQDLGDGIDEFLSRCEEFLQLPLNCDRNVPYRNPQNLNRDDDDCPMTSDIQIALRSESITLLPRSDPSSILEVDSSISEAAPPPIIRSQLYSHQKQALKFMLDRESKGGNEDLKNISRLPYGSFDEDLSPERLEIVLGGILADFMGLGKSLSTLALITTDLGPTAKGNVGNRTTLFIVPNSLIKTWEEEIETHFHPQSLQYYVHHGPKRSKTHEPFSDFQIVITSYDVISTEWRGLVNGPKPLFSFQWTRIILDEAHEIRSGNTTRAKAVYALHSERKWVMSGTPIQNRWEDLASLLYFLGVYPVHVSLKDIKSMLRNQQGQTQIKHLLSELCLRRSKEKLDLPTRTDQLRILEFEPLEAACYSRIDDETQSFLQEELCTSLSLHAATYSNILTRINSLRRVCNLGYLYRATSQVQRESVSDETSSSNTAQELFESMLALGTAECRKCRADLLSAEVNDELSFGITLDTPNSYSLLAFCGQLLCGDCIQSGHKANPKQNLDCGHIPCCQWFPVVLSQSSSSSSSPNTSYLPVKMRALQQDLKQLPASDKSIVFSFWTSTLDIVEAALDRVNFSYVRIDGTMSIKQRQEALISFSNNEYLKVILISLRCGATGLNLTVANHVFLMEPQWNPMLEDQALDRVYRIGQHKEVTTTRYIVKGTIEEGIRQQQEKKRNLAEQAYELSRQHKSWIKQVQELLSGPR